jgi:hypothetical protein
MRGHTPHNQLRIAIDHQRIIIMNKKMGLGLVGLIAVMVLGTTSTAIANDADVIQRGSCSARSSWKLKNSPENNGKKIEISYEVDQNKVGQLWRVVLNYNGTEIFRDKRTTQAPSGSFEVRRVVINQPGPDTVVARAVNLATGETCKGSVKSNF